MPHPASQQEPQKSKTVENQQLQSNDGKPEVRASPPFSHAGCSNNPGEDTPAPDTSVLRRNFGPADQSSSTAISLCGKINPKEQKYINETDPGKVRVLSSASSREVEAGPCDKTLSPDRLPLKRLSTLAQAADLLASKDSHNTLQQVPSCHLDHNGQEARNVQIDTVDSRADGLGSRDCHTSTPHQSEQHNRGPRREAWRTEKMPQLAPKMANMSRISKTAVRPRARSPSMETTQRQVPVSLAARPSEEDLFYLLMYRQEQRKERETQLTAKHEHLEDRNRQLMQQNKDYQRQIENDTSQREKLQAQVDSQKQDLRRFASRFEKLKSFANGLSNDYSQMQKDRDVLKRIQDKLAKEKGELREEAEDHRIAAESLALTLNALKTKLSELHGQVQPQEVSLQILKHELKIERDLLIQERDKNRQSELQLSILWNAQKEQSVVLQQDQKTMMGYVEQLLHKFSVLEEHAKWVEMPELKQCIGMLQSLKDTERVASSDISNVLDSVNDLADKWALLLPPVMNSANALQSKATA